MDANLTINLITYELIRLIIVSVVPAVLLNNAFIRTYLQ